MLYWLILAPILVGVGYLTFGNAETKKWVIVAQTVIVFYASYLFYQVKNTGVIIDNLGGYPYPVAITLSANNLSMVLVWVTALLFLGLFFYGYATEYFNNYTGFLYLTLEALVIALLFTDDLFNIYVLLEVSTIVITLLLTFKKDKQAVYNSMMFLFVTVVSSTFWLFGTAMIYRTFGYLDMRILSEMITQVEDPRSLILPYAFLLTAVSVKIALFPLHGWLPRAYSTPSAPPMVPAVLSGIYETAGLYLFIRLNSMFSEVIQINTFLLILGFITSILAFVKAITENDLYTLLAYSTISQIGLIVIGLAIGTEDSFWGSIYHILSHSLFKSVLFLTAGELFRQYGTRYIPKIKGVMKTMPVTGFALIFGLLGLTGAPFFNGAISKNMIGSGIDSTFLYLLLNIVTLGTVVYSIKLATMLFGENKLSSEVKEKKDVPNLQQWTMLVFGILTILTGIFGQPLMEFLYDYSYEVTLGSQIQHALTYTILLVAGFLIYKGWRKKENVIDRIVGIEMSFNAVIRSMVLFFVAVVGYMYWLV